MREKIQLNYVERWKNFGQQGELDKNRRTSNIITGVVIAISILAIACIPWLWQHKIVYDIDVSERKIASLLQVATVLDQKESLVDDIDQKKNFLDIVESKSKDPKTIYEDILNFLPEGSTLNTFSLQADNSIQISVSLPGPIDLVDLWIDLRDSGKYQKFDLDSVSLSDEEKTLSLALQLK